MSCSELDLLRLGMQEVVVVLMEGVFEKFSFWQDASSFHCVEEEGLFS